MSEKFIRDPRELVKAGEVVKVKVMELDVDRRRVGLSMRLTDEPGSQPERNSRPRNEAGNRSGKGRHKVDEQRRGRRDQTNEPVANNALARAFARAKSKDR